MPREMLIRRGYPATDVGHSTTCREEGSYYIQQWTATAAIGVVQTIMGKSLKYTTEEDMLKRGEILRALLLELSARTLGITFEVEVDKSKAFNPIMQLTVTEYWTDRTCAAWGWWWSSLLQRIVLTSDESYVEMQDIAKALELSSGTQADQWGSRLTRINTINAWNDVLLGRFTAEKFRKQGGIGNGIVYAHTRGEDS